MMRPLAANPAFARVAAPIADGIIILILWQSACDFWEVPK